MVFSRKFIVPVAAGFICLMAAGCSGDNGNNNDPFERLPNKPPIIVENSLIWLNLQTGVVGDTIVQRGVEYEYSVRAIDPDVGDRVVRYFWRFGDDPETKLDDITSVPTIRHTFGPDDKGVIYVRASDRWLGDRWAMGPEAEFPVPLSPGVEPLILTATTEARDQKTSDNQRIGLVPPGVTR